MPLREKSLAGVVLAGGRNSRMGGVDKGLIVCGGLPLAVRGVRLLGQLFEEVVLVRNSSDGYPELPPGVLQTGDLFPGMGPLAGIHAGLGCCSSEAAFCAACDMPFLTVGFIWRLIRRFRQLDCDVLLPRVAGEVEPLAAIYRRCLRGMMERILSDGQGSSIRRLFPVVNTAYFDLPDTSASRRLFTNLNTPEDMVRVCGA